MSFLRCYDRLLGRSFHYLPHSLLQLPHSLLPPLRRKRWKKSQRHRFRLILTRFLQFPRDKSAATLRFRPVRQHRSLTCRPLGHHFHFRHRLSLLEPKTILVPINKVRIIKVYVAEVQQISFENILLLRGLTILNSCFVLLLN